MNAKIQDLMTTSVVTTQPHKSIEHAAAQMHKNRVGAIPVVDTDNHPVGIVSLADLSPQVKMSAPVSSIMSEKVYTVPLYNDVSVAARIMRNHKIHHVVVTDEQKLAGVLSAFDLLKLVEDHRFVARNAPTAKRKRPARQ